jgi:hypothetical protein
VQAIQRDGWKDGLHGGRAALCCLPVRTQETELNQHLQKRTGRGVEKESSSCRAGGSDNGGLSVGAWRRSAATFGGSALTGGSGGGLEVVIGGRWWIEVVEFIIMAGKQNLDKLGAFRMSTMADEYSRGIFVEVAG